MNFTNSPTISPNQKELNHRLARVYKLILSWPEPNEVKREFSDIDIDYCETSDSDIDIDYYEASDSAIGPT